MINIRQALPIEYVLKCVHDGIKVEKFDIMNAISHWEAIKNKKPVAYATDDGDGILKNFTQEKTENMDKYTTIELYRMY